MVRNCAASLGARDWGMVGEWVKWPNDMNRWKKEILTRAQRSGCTALNTVKCRQAGPREWTTSSARCRVGAIRCQVNSRLQPDNPIMRSSNYTDDKKTPRSRLANVAYLVCRLWLTGASKQMELTWTLKDRNQSSAPAGEFSELGLFQSLKCATQYPT